MDRAGKISSSTVVLFALSAIFVYSTSTFLRMQYNFYLAVGLYTGFIFITHSMGYKWKTLSSPLTIWFFFCLMISLLLLHSTSRNIWVVHLSGYIHIYFWVGAFCFLADNFSLPILRKFIASNLFLLYICVIATIRALDLYPLAARGMYGVAEGIENTDHLHKMGCGGFGFVYSFVYVTIGFMSAIMNKQLNPKERKWSIILLLCIMYMIMQAGFTMAILFSVFAIICCLFYVKNKRGDGILWLFILLMVIVVFHRNIIEEVQKFADLFGVAIVSEKMDNIMHALDSKDLMELSRFQVYSVSVEGFLANPIFGSGYSKGDSQILSLFSFIGFSGVIYIGLLHCSFQTIKSYTNRRYMNVMEAIAICLAVLNPFNDMTLMSMVFMFAPLILYVVYPVGVCERELFCK